MNLSVLNPSPQRGVGPVFRLCCGDQEPGIIAVSGSLPSTIQASVTALNGAGLATIAANVAPLSTSDQQPLYQLVTSFNNLGAFLGVNFPSL